MDDEGKMWWINVIAVLVVLHILYPFLIMGLIRLPELRAYLTQLEGYPVVFTALASLFYVLYTMWSWRLAENARGETIEGMVAFTVALVAFLILSARIKRKMDPEPVNLQDLSGQVVVVTGGNAGIGYEAALGFAKQGAEVIIAARDKVKGEKAASDINRQLKDKKDPKAKFMQLDLNSLDNVKAFVKLYKSKYTRLDVLVNNAGMAYVPPEGQYTKEGFEAGFGVMHLAHFLLTRLFLSTLLQTPGSRVINVASHGHTMAKPEFMKNFKDDCVKSGGGMYFRAKLCNVLFTLEMHRRFGSKLPVYVLHPGAVYTGIWADYSALSFGLPHLKYFLRFAAPLVLRTPRQGAVDIIYLGASKDMKTKWGKSKPGHPKGSGLYYISCTPVVPSALSRDEALAKDLWSKSNGFVASWIADAKDDEADSCRIWDSDKGDDTKEGQQQKPKKKGVDAAGW